MAHVTKHRRKYVYAKHTTIVEKLAMHPVKTIRAMKTGKERKKSCIACTTSGSWLAQGTRREAGQKRNKEDSKKGRKK